MRALARSLSASALAPCSSRRAPRARPVRAAPKRAMAACAAAPAEAYTQLKAELSEIAALGGIEGLLSWDQAAMLPPGAQELRAKQMAALAGVIHARKTATELGELIAKCGGESADAAVLGEGATAFDVANVKRAHEDYQRATRVPAEMAKREAELGAKGYAAWMEAREKSDWSLFSPVLKEWVALVRERCALVRPDLPPYDAALSDYERGLTKARLDEIFPPVRKALSALVAEVYEAAEKNGGVPVALSGAKSVMTGAFDTDKQAALSKEVALAMGFDESRGRLDVSAHPFTGGAGPEDTRMTTRYKADDLSEGLTGTIHETGHALYEQARPAKYAGQPVSSAHSMGIHESQSLLWERMVALGPEFAKFLLPKLGEQFGGQFEGVTPEQLHASFNIVKKPSLIRVESDELTYPLHIILRYELECGLIDGSIEVDDLPRLWNEKMETMLGCTPPDDAKGVLQDVHWSAGAFGYFPTYSLGAMYACQIFDYAKTQLDGLEEEIEKGEFSRLREWLRTNVHELGSRYDTADELMLAVTGEPLKPDAFVAFLSRKYRALYGLS